MIHTLIFGAPVRSGDRDLGTLHRIIVNNGVANQFTVNPGGLFGGPERVVPINDVAEAAADAITLNTAEDEWNAYSAYEIEQYTVTDQAAAPDLYPVAPRLPITGEVFDATTAEGTGTGQIFSDMVVALTNETQVADFGQLAGMVLDTGIPQDLLLDNGQSVPFTMVGIVDSERIELGPVGGRLDGVTARDGLDEAPRRMDGAIPPGTIGQERRHDK